MNKHAINIQTFVLLAVFLVVLIAQRVDVRPRDVLEEVRAAKDEAEAIRGEIEALADEIQKTTEEPAEKEGDK